MGGVVGYLIVILFFFTLIFAIIIPRKYAAKPMHVFYDDRVWLRRSNTTMFKDDIELIRWEKNGASILPKGYQSAGFMEKHHLNQKYEGSMIGTLFIKDVDKLEAFLKDWIGEDKIRTKDLFEL